MIRPDPAGDSYPFVVQEHREASGSHWDLMLQSPHSHGGPDDHVLATWKFSVPLRPENLSGPLPAQALPNHRRHYLDYEGPIRNDRGQCHIVDRGTFELVEFHPDRWVVRFSGQILTGECILRKTGEPDAWALTRQEGKQI